MSSLPGFPNSTDNNWRWKSQPTWEYNCLAFSVHREDVWMWPDEREQFSWPVGMPRGDDIATLRAFFQSIGFSVCASTAIEAGFEKIAIYAMGTDPSHVARQIGSGRWKSKMSGGIDIEHDDLTVLADGDYGNVQLIMRRKWNGPPRLPPLYPPPPRLITGSGMPLLP